MQWLTAAPSPSIQLLALVLSAIVIADVLRRSTRNRIKSERKGHPLPPGPTPLPILGSVLSVDAQQPWLTYTAWKAKYGDVMYVRLLDSDVIILSSHADAIELLEKRSQIYSDRPFLATVEPYGQGGNFTFAQYGPHWRLCRRILHQTFRAEAALTFRPIQLRQARQLITNIINNPNGYQSHYSTFAAAVGMSIVYGYEPELQEDPLVKVIHDFTDASLPALIPEVAVLLKSFPFLLRVPEWIPVLSRIRCEASKAYTLGTEAMETPYKWVGKRVEAKEDIVTDTMVFDHIQRMERFDGSYRAEYEKALKKASFSALLGSAETTSATLMTFTLAMVKNPHIWKRAQTEIDAVIGADRLPEYEDRSYLPYVDAIVRETWRWEPLGPMGVPHAVISDDIYKNYYIPRGATVFANVWAISRDERRYPDPGTFIPERFLDSEGKLNQDNPADFVFGFGRRICPGRYLADAAVWIGIATMLATLDFNAIKDANGNDIKFEAKFANGLAHRPVSFPCDLSLRTHITKEALQRFVAK